jgi:hypothetical protein
MESLELVTSKKTTFKVDVTVAVHGQVLGAVLPVREKPQLFFLNN